MIDIDAIFHGVDKKIVSVVNKGKWRDGFLASFDTMESVSGIKIDNGEIWVESNPDFFPLQVYGFDGTPGAYAKYANHYAYASVQIRRAAQLSDFQIIAHPNKSAGLDGLKRKVRDRFYEHSLRCIQRWETENVLGGQNIIDFVVEAGLGIRQNGFYIGEVTGKEENGIFIPNLPSYRDPSIIRGWVRQGDKIVGVVLSKSGETDFGKIEHTNVLLPWYKLFHIRNMPKGENPLGVSELRHLIGLMDNDITIGRVEAVAVASRSRGQLFVEQETGFNSSGDPEEASRVDDYIQKYGQGYEVGGLRLPPGWKAKLLSPDSAMPNLTSVRQFYMNLMYLAMGAEDRGIGAKGDVGSYNSREVAEESAQVDIRYILGVVCRGLSSVAARFGHFSGLGYGKTEYLLPSHFEAVFETQASRAGRVQSFADMAKSQVVSPTERDEDYIRETLRFPRRDDNDQS